MARFLFAVTEVDDGDKGGDCPLEDEDEARQEGNAKDESQGSFAEGDERGRD